MKITILYYSKSGKTREMAQVIAGGMQKQGNIEVGIFDFDNIDYEFLNESRAVVLGTPTYYANTCWQLDRWFDESHNCKLGGKIGAAFATADYAQGGADIAIQNIISRMLVKGMLVYSGGSANGQPFIHLGAVALKENFESSKAMFEIFGERIAAKAKEIFVD
ncbi:MAG: flavodoxin domain-containing protein [Oscillospiraceae bacterium]